MQLTDGFDFPAGKPDGADHWIAAGLAEEEYHQRFGVWHTGEDWNRGSGDADLTGEPYTHDPAQRKQIAFDAVKWVLKSAQTM